MVKKPRRRLKINDPRKLTEWLKVAAGPLLALAAFVAAVIKNIDWVKKALSPWLPEEWAEPAAIALCVLLAVAVLGLSWRVVVKRSRLVRPGKFDLRVRHPKDLLGRERDVEDLRAL